MNPATHGAGRPTFGDLKDTVKRYLREQAWQSHSPKGLMRKIPNDRN